MIYPAVAKAVDTSVPVKGPNDGGKGKHFVVRGARKDSVAVRVLMRDGRIVVGVTSSANDEDAMIWQTADTDYEVFVTGTFNDWGLSQMTPDDEKPGVFKYLLNFESSYEEEFQIVFDGDRNRTLHPTQPSALLGEGLVVAPDGNGEGLNWCIPGEAFDRYHIILDL